MPDDLFALVAEHLIAPSAGLADSSNTWQQQFRIHRELQGAGFHRTLVFNIKCIEQHSIDLQGCQTSLLQPLPSSIYADPYQLEDLARSSSSSLATEAIGSAGGGPYNFKVLGTLDLEL